MTQPPSEANSPGLDTIIAPEVHADEFSEIIRNLARSADINTVLEIGSSSGEGSTKAWVEGLKENPRQPRLYCMEVSKVRCAALEHRWSQENFVECLLGSSVDLDQFPPAAEVERFHREVHGPLQQYPLDQVLGWLKADIDYIRRENAPTGLIREIKRSRGIEHFGAVLIDGSEFTGNAELDEVYGAEFILLDDTQTFKCHAAHQRLLHDPGYELIAENAKLRHGFSVFRRKRRSALDPLPTDTPVHFFTIVLNGMPFIRHHIEVLRQLPFRWHWHVVEGAATLTHDTAWSVPSGGLLPTAVHHDGLSVDGTSGYLDDLVKQWPDRVTVYRKPSGQLWDGKIEMISEPLKHIFEDAVLWEIDTDELWTVEQLGQGRRMFLQSPEKTAAYFWCRYFVGERLLISTRNNYAQNPAHEWLRAWRFRPGMKWLTHEPPALAERMADSTWRDTTKGRVFTHAETEAAGLVFQHFAYATEEQVAFKESYYGYAGALNGWRKLQATGSFPCQLRDVLPWVKDNTCVDTADALGVTPLATRNPGTGEWTFQSRGGSERQNAPMRSVVVDGVFFQLNNTGIGRVWMEVLKQWAASGFGKNVWVLDRDGTAPRIGGLHYRKLDRFNPEKSGEDASMLQAVCDELNAGVFVSSYYTCPLGTPSVAVMYDMIPELLRITQNNDWQWREKDLCILHASRWVCISGTTAEDLVRLHPQIPREQVTVTHLAPSPEFSVPDAASLQSFRERHGLKDDYLLLAGERIGIHTGTQGYKNTALVFKAWSLLPLEQRRRLTILCAGGKPELEEELRLLAPDADVKIIRFSDEDLRLAYGGAVALAYPSLYEGFGLPVIEAMACGCPVVTCKRSSLVEVAGDAAIFVDPWDANETTKAIQSLRADPEMRASLISRGLTQAAKFSFPKMASELASVLQEVAETAPADKALHLAKLWETCRGLQSQQAALEAQLKKANAEIKETRKALKQAEKMTAKAESRLKQERNERRRPLQRLWNKLRGKK